MQCSVRLLCPRDSFVFAMALNLDTLSLRESHYYFMLTTTYCVDIVTSYAHICMYVFVHYERGIKDVKELHNLGMRGTLHLRGHLLCM